MKAQTAGRRPHYVPTLAEFVEANMLKLVARVLVPLALAVGAWLGPRYLDEILNNLRQQVSQSLDSATQISKVVEEDRRQSLNFQNQISQTLAAVQATAQAQYQELKSNMQDNTHRMERLEDKVDKAGKK